jgi:hypothetical protein
MVKELRMADIEDEIFLRWLIKDPSWCLFYHRDRVRQLLPVLAESHILVTGIKEELTKQLQEIEGGRLG